ncbi:MAG: AAA family ATPase [Methanomassiliicoccus sp.]|nr:AAA family ATPase [Methanomassiliicoccus sp.]
MTFIIAVAGKGGVGKSTLSALMVQELAARTGKVILAVDADPNSNLGEKLGITVERTIGDLREELVRRSEDVTGSKHQEAMYQLRLAMEEGTDFDLVTMGRSEGRGCYCYVNNLLRTFLDEIMSQYGHVVIDNEAGMEHLSRRTCQRMDVLMVVSDATKMGLETASRILSLSKDMEIDIGKSVLIINRIRGELPAKVKDVVPPGFSKTFLLPHDAALEELAMGSSQLTSLPQDSMLREAVQRLISELK